ncbi:hypothetical protein ES703_116205 [subsurface metagenome]
MKKGSEIVMKIKKFLKQSIRSQISEAIESYIEATEANMIEKMF